MERVFTDSTNIKGLYTNLLDPLMKAEYAVDNTRSIIYAFDIVTNPDYIAGKVSDMTNLTVISVEDIKSYTCNLAKAIHDAGYGKLVTSVVCKKILFYFKKMLRICNYFSK